MAVYTSSPSGRRELADLFGRALETVEPLDQLPLHTALSMCPLLDREVIVGHLARRVDSLDVHLAELRAQQQAVAEAAPPHVGRVLELRVASAEVERAWVGDLLGELRAGGLEFAGETVTWLSAADDPGGRWPPTGSATGGFSPVADEFLSVHWSVLAAAPGCGRLRATGRATRVAIFKFEHRPGRRPARRDVR